MNRTLGFDKIYVINLAKRKDRKESLLKKFMFVRTLSMKAVCAVNQTQGCCFKRVMNLILTCPEALWLVTVRVTC